MSFPLTQIPYLTTDQMIAVDRAMIDEFHIELIQMMENAGRNLAHLARTRFLDGDPVGKVIVILAGTGGNGGGALVCARHLHNWGGRVQMVLSRAPDAFSGVPAHQLAILRRMQVPLVAAAALAQIERPDVIVDGLIGYRLTGAPHGTAADLIRWANTEPSPILALDVPSGVDTTTGTVYAPAIQARATLTLALPKVGLVAPGVAQYVGELYLADISVPPALYAGLSPALTVGPVFARDEIVRLR